MNEFLQEKFPDMTPVKSAPALSTVNGIGFTVYGRRDFDAETGTYVKTQCFCLLFLPLFFTKAFRVADAPEGGWYFIGRVPMSGFAKVWNLLVVAVIAGAVGLGMWAHHTSRPDYQARQKLAEADELVAQGKLQAAAELYRVVALGPYPNQNGVALQKLGDMFDQPVAATHPEEAARALAVAMDLEKAGRKVERLYDRALALSKKFADANPRLALKLLEPVLALTPDPLETARYRRPLLEKALAQEPNNLDLVSELAGVLELQKELAAAEKLLAPHAAALGSREGARILGQIYARQGKFEEAATLLNTYVETRLPRSLEAEKSLQAVFQQVQQECRDLFNTGKAPGIDFKQFDQSDDAAKSRIYREFFSNRLKDHPEYKKALAQIDEVGRVVPVALDLGQVLLRRAQGLADPDARRKELEKAEKTFLSIRGEAGQTEEYRLNLGQVYYWLGKHKEGSQIFEEYLKAANRQPVALTRAASAMRQVGLDSEARKLAEEAYNSDPDAKMKYQYASFRAVLATDLDDQIHWLNKANPEDKRTKAELCRTRGMKCLQAGDDDKAAQELRQAISIYESLPEDFVTLNNCALNRFDLFQATGDSEEISRGIAQLEKSLNLKRDDTITLQNLAEYLLFKTLSDVVSSRIDLKLLREMGSYTHLEFLYDTRDDISKLREEFQKNANLPRVIEYYERLQLLAPKKAGIYASLSGIYYFTHDLDKLQAVAQRVERATLDMEEANKRVRENLEGKKDDKRRKEMPALLARLERELKAARKVGGPTLGVAANNWANLQIAADFLDMPANADALVALAEEAYKAAPSQGTRHLMVTTLVFRAHKDLLTKEKTYQQWSARSKRALGYSLLLGVALFHDGPAQKAALQNADVQRALDLLKDTVERFPERGSEWTWAMLHKAHAEEAAKLAAHLEKDKRGKLERGVRNQSSSPLNGEHIMRRYWSLHMAGQADQAAAVLDEARKQGVPLPVLTAK